MAVMLPRGNTYLPRLTANAIKLRKIQRGAQYFSLLFLAMNAG